jgi:hypothetical protein
VSESIKAVLRDLALVAGAVLLALVPGTPPRMLAGFALTVLLPGYALLRGLRIPTPLHSPAGLLHCVAGSLCLGPLTLRLAGLLVPFDRFSVLAILAGLPAALIGIGFLRPSAPRPIPRATGGRGFYLILVLTLLLLVPTLWISAAPDGGETRVKGWDLNNHLSIGESIAAQGLPPRNPFLLSSTPFYYHTFFHILLAAVLVLTGSTAHSYFCIALLTLLMAATFLATLHWVVAELTGRPRVALLALPFVSLVGGFDVFPIVGLALWRGEPGGLGGMLMRHWNVDGWISNRGMIVPTFFAGFYWVPHAVAALIVFLLALLFLRRTEAGLGAIGAAGACLASMAGYNGYVALAGAVTLLVLRGADLSRFLLYRSRFSRSVLARSGLAGLTAVVLGWPVLSLYTGERGDVEKFRWLSLGPRLPLQVILEFGPALLFGLMGMEIARREEDRRKGLMPFLLMGTVSFLMLVALSSTGENNDLAMRVSMLVWICLAVFGGVAMDRIFFPETGAAGRSSRRRWLAIAAAAPGVVSILWFAAGASLSKPDLPADEVSAGRWIRAHLPAGAAVQGSPLRSSPDLVYLSGHHAVLSDSWAGRLFYSNPEDFSRNLDALRQAFTSDSPESACERLASLGAGAIVVGPPEEESFPRLARPDPLPCLRPAYRRGSYRVFLFQR